LVRVGIGLVIVGQGRLRLVRLDKSWGRLKLLRVA